VSATGWEARRLWSGGGGNVSKTTEGGGLWSEGGGRGRRWRAGGCGGCGILDLDLVTYCAVNWLTIAQVRRQTEMHSGRQRAEV